MNTEPLLCAHCGETFEKEVGQANKQRRVLGARVRFFCSRPCFAASRALHKPKAQRVAEKAAYDREYRAKNLETIKAEKREYFQRTYDPEAARVARAPKLAWQREYGKNYRASPEWIAHKTEYDRQLRAAEYGDLAECHAILIELERQIRKQEPDKYERAKARGYYDTKRIAKLENRHAQAIR